MTGRPDRSGDHRVDQGGHRRLPGPDRPGDRGSGSASAASTSAVPLVVPTAGLTARSRDALGRGCRFGAGTW